MKVGEDTVEMSRFVEDGGKNSGRALLNSSGVLVAGKELYCFLEMKEKSLAVIKFNCAIKLCLCTKEV